MRFRIHRQLAAAFESVAITLGGKHGLVTKGDQYKLKRPRKQASTLGPDFYRAYKEKKI